MAATYLMTDLTYRSQVPWCGVLGVTDPLRGFLVLGEEGKEGQGNEGHDMRGKPGRNHRYVRSSGTAASDQKSMNDAVDTDPPTGRLHNSSSHLPHRPLLPSNGMPRRH